MHQAQDMSLKSTNLKGKKDLFRPVNLLKSSFTAELYGTRLETYWLRSIKCWMYQNLIWALKTLKNFALFPLDVANQTYNLHICSLNSSPALASANHLITSGNCFPIHKTENSKICAARSAEKECPMTAKLSLIKNKNKNITSPYKVCFICVLTPWKPQQGYQDNRRTLSHSITMGKKDIYATKQWATAKQLQPLSDTNHEQIILQLKKWPWKPAVHL